MAEKVDMDQGVEKIPVELKAASETGSSAGSDVAHGEWTIEEEKRIV